jgi:hypothetical protein
MKKYIIFLLVVSLALISMVQILTTGRSSAKSINLPPERINLKPGEGLDQVQIYCAVCHSLDYIPLQPKGTKVQWTATVNKMIKVFGAQVPEGKISILSDYLTAQYGKGK